MGSIEVFRLELAALTLTCRRDFAGSYVLESDKFRSSMTIDAASALASAGERLRVRAQVAVATGNEMKPGAVFRRELPTARIEVGVTDAGDTVYVQVNDVRVQLDETQAEQLQFALGRLRDDVDAVYQVSAVPQQMNLTPGIVAAYMRRSSW
jgi:hypothetical protein